LSSSMFTWILSSSISVLSPSNLGIAVNNLFTLSLIFARWTIADSSDGVDSEEWLLFSVSVVSGLFTPGRWQLRPN
jgi:hypothetical protein